MPLVSKTMLVKRAPWMPSAHHKIQIFIDMHIHCLCVCFLLPRDPGTLFNFYPSINEYFHRLQRVG